MKRIITEESEPMVTIRESWFRELLANQAPQWNHIPQVDGGMAAEIEPFMRHHPPGPPINPSPRQAPTPPPLGDFRIMNPSTPVIRPPGGKVVPSGRNEATAPDPLP